MNTKSSIRFAIAAALLGATAVPAFAQTVTPPASGPTPVPGLVPGGLIVEVWDASTGASLAEWLGGDSSTFGAPSATVAGTNINYGVLGGTAFSSLFSASEIAAGNVQFIVTAVNDVTPGTPLVDVTAQAGTTVTGNRLSGFVAYATQINTGISAVMNGTVACNNVNPCTATATTQATSTITNLGQTAIGTIAISGTAGGAALNFYQIATTGTTLTVQTPVQFASGTNAATWTLSATGDLVYAVAGGTTVPLPAAVWLLGSGLLGLTGIARRKALAA